MSGTGLQGQELIINPFLLPLGQKVSPPVKKKKVIVIAGPTGVGKTRLSVKIAGALGGEVVSCDSMQVYRGMDIGTAKIKPEEQQGIRHHLIDSRDLDESFNVVDFCHDAAQAFKEIFARNHVPIVTGGTGFYVHALMYGPPQGPASVPEVRQKIEGEMDEKGSLVLFDRLKELDPEYAATITFRDRHKIVRALEIITLTNQRVSFFQQQQLPLEDFDFRCWFIYMPKEVLYPLIDARCDQMLADGFVDEVKRLKVEGLESNSTACQAIGYRQCLEFLKTSQSKDDWDHFVRQFKQASRRYAKRQFTWFRKEPLFRWLNTHEVSFDTTVEMIIQDYEHSR